LEEIFSIKLPENSFLHVVGGCFLSVFCSKKIMKNIQREMGAFLSTEAF
jgi:hypothetical protein